MGRVAAAFICQHWTLSNFYFYIFAGVLWPAGLSQPAAASCIFFFFFLFFTPNQTAFTALQGESSAWESFRSQLSHVVWVFVGEVLRYASELWREAIKKKMEKMGKIFPTFSIHCWEFKELNSRLNIEVSAIPGWFLAARWCLCLLLRVFILPPRFSFHFSSRLLYADIVLSCRGPPAAFSSLSMHHIFSQKCQWTETKWQMKERFCHFHRSG